MPLFSLEAKLIAGAVTLAAVLAGAAAFVSHERSLGEERQKSKQTADALVAEQESRRESDRRAVAIAQKATDADQAASAARADADAANDAAGRLRQRIATLNRGAADHSASAPAGAASSSTDVVPADLFASVVYDAGRYAAIADAARIAGQACQQSYDALTK